MTNFQYMIYDINFQTVRFFENISNIIMYILYFFLETIKCQHEKICYEIC